MFVKELHTKRKRGQLIRLRCSRYRQTPNVLKRVKVHAIKRELRLQFLYIALEFCRFSNNKNLKVDVQILYVLDAFASKLLSLNRLQSMLGLYSLNRNFVFYFFLQPIGIFCFKGYTLLFLLPQLPVGFSKNFVLFVCKNTKIFQYRVGFPCFSL